METEQLPYGMRPDVPVTYPRCAICGAMGGLALDEQPLMPLIRQMGTHIREHHPKADVQDALLLVPDVGHPPADCDITEWVAAYNERAGLAL